MNTLTYLWHAEYIYHAMLCYVLWLWASVCRARGAKLAAAPAGTRFPLRAEGLGAGSALLFYMMFVSSLTSKFWAREATECT